MKRAEVILNDVQWHYPPELPSKDGRVWLVEEWKHHPNELRLIDYTVEGGWNTTRDQYGLHDEYKFEIDNLVAWSYDCPYEVKVTDDV